VLEFEYRVIGAEPTTHRVRPIQPVTPPRVAAAIAEHNRPVRWRVVAFDMDVPDFMDRGGDVFPLDPSAPPVSAVEVLDGLRATPGYAAYHDRLAAWPAAEGASPSTSTRSPAGRPPRSVVLVCRARRGPTAGRRRHR
jgi:hypothetical protein